MMIWHSFVDDELDHSTKTTYRHASSNRIDFVNAGYTKTNPVCLKCRIVNQFSVVCDSYFLHNSPVTGWLAGVIGQFGKYTLNAAAFNTRDLFFSFLWAWRATGAFDTPNTYYVFVPRFD